MTTAMATPARSIGCRAWVMARISTISTAMKMATATPRRSMVPMSTRIGRAVEVVGPMGSRK